MGNTAESTAWVKLFHPSVRVLGVGLAFLTIGNVAKFVAPGFTPWVSETIKEQTGVDLFQRGWTEEKREKDPVGYLQWAERKLTGQNEEVQEQEVECRNELLSLQELHREHRIKSEKTRSYLLEGRQLYKLHVDGEVNRPIEFSGRSYPNLGVFKQQVEVLFNEHQAQKAQTAQIEEIEAKLSQRHQRLNLQRAKIKLALGLIGPQISIAKASKITSDFETLSETTMNILRETDNVLQEPIIGITEDLEKRVPRDVPVSLGGSQEFRDFLSAE